MPSEVDLFETAQQKYRRVHRERLRERNRENMRKRRADPAKRALHVASQQRTYFRSKYGLELVDIERMWIEHHKCCDLCGTPKPAPHHEGRACDKLVIDHCHDTNQVRGMLCYKCNTALGQLGDTVESIERVRRYVLCIKYGT